MANAVRRTLLQRIANYFLEWDGEDKTAPTIQLHIDELRAISSMHTELCRLEEEKRRTSKANESVKGDLISRSELMEALNKSDKDARTDADIQGYCDGWNDVVEIINEQPTAYNDGWTPVMSKATLVIDMPGSCSKCKFMYEFYGVKKCHLLNILQNGGKAILSQEEFTKKRDENCPLVPMLDKYPEKDYTP